MLHLIPAPLHRAGLRLAHFLRKIWWRLARPALSGVTVIALDDAGRVLLVRHSYGKGWWTLPGGGLHAGEDPLAAALRELAEEVGCVLAAPVSLGTHRSTIHGAPVTRHVFAGKALGTPLPDGREVAEARFFERDALPEPRNGFVGECLALLDAPPP
jgi:8-oxo-dGTP pyrophosphatase MutT (NUDIX family)